MGKLTPDTPPLESWPRVLGPPPHLHSFFQSNSICDPGPREPISITNQTCFLAKPSKPGNRNQTHPEAKYRAPQVENRLLKFCPYGNSVQTPEGEGHHVKPTISFPKRKEDWTHISQEVSDKETWQFGGFWNLSPGYLPLPFNTQVWNALPVLGQTLQSCISNFILNTTTGTIYKNKQTEALRLLLDPYIVLTGQVMLINVSQSLSDPGWKVRGPV